MRRAEGCQLTVAVERVRRADQRRRWLEVGRVLFAAEPRWAPPLRSYETWLVGRRHPMRRAGADLARFLVRRDGHVVGRVAAHRRPDDDVVWFGALEFADDVDPVRALVDAVLAWGGAERIAGPALWSPDDGDAGILVEGFDHPGGTARPWHPPWYAEHLATAGLRPTTSFPRWRRPTGGEPTMTAGGARPPHAGRLADPALVLTGPAGDIAAVPDVSRLARRPTEASVVRCEGDPDVVVPALLAAASSYDTVWAPTGDGPPDTVHRLFEAATGS